MPTIVNMKALGGVALEQALGAELRELLSGIAWLRPWQVEHVAETPDAGFDLLATLPLPEGKAALCVVCHTHQAYLFWNRSREATRNCPRHESL